MTNSEKAALDAANIENGGELKSAWCAALPCSEGYFTTPPGTISSILAAFQDPVTAAELAAALGMKDTREITRRVQLERLHGIPICASCDAERPGFYLARNPGELDRYLKSLDRRIRMVSATFKALELALDEWRGQLRLEGWEADDAE